MHSLESTLESDLSSSSSNISTPRKKVVNTKISQHSFLQQADNLIGSSIPSMKGYYLKHALSTVNEERIVQDKIYENYQCQQCGVYYGLCMTQFRTRSKWKRKTDTSRNGRVRVGHSFVQIKCLNCGVSKNISLQKSSSIKRINAVGRRINCTNTPRLAKKLFNDSQYQSTPNDFVEKLRKQSTPGSVNIPIINKPSKSAKKCYRMKPKTLVEMNKREKGDKEPDLFSFLSSI